MNITKRVLRLMDERDKARYNEDLNRRNFVREKERAEKYQKLVEELYLTHDPSVQGRIKEHLGATWGVNLEMREIYSKPLKQQLETQVWSVAK